MGNTGNYKDIEKIRVLDLGNIDYLDTQAIYHSVAHAFKEDSPDTLILVSPTSTYACIGYFQDMEQEVEIGFCEKNNIPVLRREVGGGAVLLDSEQVFFQFVFNKNKIPRDVNVLYEDFLLPATRTYKKLGLEVVHRPVNDLQINGRKIGGSGACEIGDSMVIVGSFMFDFNHELMSKILNVPSEKFRDKLYKNVKEYVTTIKREFTYLDLLPPGREKIVDTFLEEVSGAFSAELKYGDGLLNNEEAMLLEMRKRLTSSSWSFKKGRFADRKVKITAGINLFEGSHKSPGGLIRVTFTLKDNMISDLSISGDFTMIPGDGLSLIEKELEDSVLDLEVLTGKLEKIYDKNHIQSPGVDPRDFIDAIEKTVNDLR